MKYIPILREMMLPLTNEMVTSSLWSWELITKKRQWWLEQFVYLIRKAVMNEAREFSRSCSMTATTIGLFRHYYFSFFFTIYTLFPTLQSWQQCRVPSLSLPAHRSLHIPGFVLPLMPPVAEGSWPPWEMDLQSAQNRESLMSNLDATCVYVCWWFIQANRSVLMMSTLCQN